MRDFSRPGRSLVMSTRGMAATSHPLASLAAIDVLQSGGNAMDAAIAACAVQCVVEPGSTGIGGDCFALYAREGREVVAFNGSGRAPAGAGIDRFEALDIGRIARRSAHAVTMPGSVDAWQTLARDHGSRSLGELLQPAIRLARDGYVVSPRVALDWSEQETLLGDDIHARRIFTDEGRPLQAGSVHRQPELARTLAAIAEHGRDAFYGGAVAADMVERLSELGGLHTLQDLADTRGQYVTPVTTMFRGREIHECPPNGQGIIALLLLNILSRCETDGGPLSVERLHVEMEAARLAYSVRDAVVADPDAASVPVRRLLSDSLADELHSAIRRDRRLAELPVVDMPAHEDTVYIAVVDRQRNAASFINSLFSPFGSGIVAPRSGVLFNNRAEGFSLRRGHPNAIAPGKRPMHTIIPGLAMHEGRLEYCFGVMGGQYQALGHARLLAQILDFGLDPQSAIDLPRASPLFGTNKLEVEQSMPSDIQEGLSALGHAIVRPPRPIGSAQVIHVNWETGVLTGASDPRKDGCALGY